MYLISFPELDKHFEKEDQIYDWIKADHTRPLLRTEQFIKEHLPEYLKDIYKLVADIGPNPVIAKDYRIVGVIGWGSKSIVYCGLNIGHKLNHKPKYVAIKIRYGRLFLFKPKMTSIEMKQYTDHFEKVSGTHDHFPEIYETSTELEWRISCQVMELLGPSLDTLKKTFKEFSSKTRSNIILQLDEAISSIPQNQIRFAIKPSQILTQYGGNNLKIINYNYFVSAGQEIKFEDRASVDSLRFVPADYLDAVIKGNKITPMKQNAGQSLYYNLLYLFGNSDDEIWKKVDGRAKVVAEHYSTGTPRIMEIARHIFESDDTGNLRDYCNRLLVADVGNRRLKIEEAVRNYHEDPTFFYDWSGSFNRIEGCVHVTPGSNLQLINWPKK